MHDHCRPGQHDHTAPSSPILVRLRSYYEKQMRINLYQQWTGLSFGQSMKALADVRFKLAAWHELCNC